MKKDRRAYGVQSGKSTEEEAAASRMIASTVAHVLGFGRYANKSYKLGKELKLPRVLHKRSRLCIGPCW